MAKLFTKPLNILLLISCVSIAFANNDTPENRIVGGNTVNIESAPHLVSLRYKPNASAPFKHRCSGTIYSKDIVLTTARCVFGLNYQQLQILAGSSYSSQSNGYIYLINSTRIHPDLNYFFYDNDLAIVRLKFPLNTYNPRVISTIELAVTLPVAGNIAKVAGWGVTAEQSVQAERLQEAKVQLMDDTQCKAAYGPGRISASMFCAGGVNAVGNVVDACQGDAGSALVSNDEAVGLVSWGSGCGRVGYPGVYTNLIHMKAWIESVAQLEE